MKFAFDIIFYSIDLHVGVYNINRLDHQNEPKMLKLHCAVQFLARGEASYHVKMYHCPMTCFISLKDNLRSCNHHIKIFQFSCPNHTDPFLLGGTQGSNFKTKCPSGRVVTVTWNESKWIIMWIEVSLNIKGISVP